MLFGYPIEATAQNWFHEALLAMIDAVHVGVEAGGSSLPWPEIIPVPYRDRLKNRPSLGLYLDAYRKAFARLSHANQARVKQCIVQQNEIEQLLAGTAGCDQIDALPKAVREPIKTLFSFGYGLLSDLGIRDRQYQVIYAQNAQRVCPFCGCEFFDAPGAYREDLDHYLAKSLYPFAAANLKNLVPMGAKCNQKYKLAQDMLRDEFGIRRRAFYPYTTAGVRVTLFASDTSQVPDGCPPIWHIDFEPNSQECETWDAVFAIRARYRRDVLDQFFLEWVRAFVAWFKKRFEAASLSTDQHLIDAMSQYVEDLQMQRLSGRDFLRPMVFEMLVRHCVGGNERLLQFLRQLVIPSSIVPLET